MGLTSVHDLVLLPEIRQAPQHLQGGGAGGRRGVLGGGSPLSRSSGQTRAATVCGTAWGLAFRRGTVTSPLVGAMPRSPALTPPPSAEADTAGGARPAEGETRREAPPAGLRASGWAPCLGGRPPSVCVVCHGPRCWAVPTTPKTGGVRWLHRHGREEARHGAGRAAYLGPRTRVCGAGRRPRSARSGLRPGRTRWRPSALQGPHCHGPRGGGRSSTRQRLHTHRDADLPQDLLRNSLGFLQHLVQGAAVLGAAQGERGAL